MRKSFDKGYPIEAVYLATKKISTVEILIEERHVTVKGISGDECRLHLVDYGDETIIKSEDLRALPAYYVNPSVAYRCTLDVSKFIEREIPKEWVIFFKERRPIRNIYMGTKNDQMLIRLVNCDDIFLGENCQLVNLC